MFQSKGTIFSCCGQRIFFHIFVITIGNLTSLLINWLGHHARVVDHLAVKKSPGCTTRRWIYFEQDKNDGKFTLLLLYSHLLRLLLIIWTLIFTLNVFSSVFIV